MDNQFIVRVKERKEKLESARLQLKQKFIGIDSVIDKIIESISLWYLTPEFQFRPLIVSLWGITGVGKTDLVRTLVKQLGFSDKFVEIQMDTKNEYYKNIQDYLNNTSFENNEQCVLLLDEIQRYRTIDENGKMIEQKYFNDVWMLLSDGKFQNDAQRKSEIMQMLLDEMYYSEQDSLKKTESDESDENQPLAPSNGTKKTGRYKTSMWVATRFKKLLNINHTIEDIMKMSLEERFNIMELALKNDDINDGKSYEKLLIFISGNLDEAFKMADDVEDVESDADIYHEISKRINIINIKKALADKFKPEQIARFGNNHIIYPCLDKMSYYKIIKQNCDKILNKVRDEHSIDIELTQGVYDVIYRNGVFPTQGVRPVISTVNNLLGNSIPYFVYNAYLNNVKNLKIDIQNKTLFTNINGSLYETAIQLEIDDIRDGKSLDEKTLVIAHELGHSLVYGILFHTPPKQININSAGLSNGFIITHNSLDNKTFIRNQIAILLSGQVAEELVFGEEFKSNGSSQDIYMATDLAGKYVRRYGMDGILTRIYNPNVQDNGELNYNTDKTNDVIENILVEEKKRAKDILMKHIKVYKELIKHTVDNNRIDTQTFIDICKNNGIILQERELNDKIIYSYDDKLKNFLNN